MNGSVFRYQTKQGVRFGYVVELPRGADGRRKQRRVRGFESADAADSARMKEVLGRRDGTWIDPSTDPLSAYLAQWLEVRAPHVAASTLASYKHVFASRLDDGLLATPLGKVQKLRLQRWVNDLAARYAPRTVRHSVVVLCAALADAVEWHLIPTNPAAGLDRPRVARADKRAWTAEQARAFLASTADHPDHCLWRLLLDSGMRIGEALALRWPDLDLAAGDVRVERTLTIDEDHRTVVGAYTKTDAGRRSVGLAAETVAALRAHKANQNARRLELGPLWRDDGLVFDRGDGRFCADSTVRQRFDRTVERAGLPALNGPHGLRHTNATLLMEAGVPLKVIQQRLGHSSIAVTADLYTHVTRDADRAASDALRRTLAG